MAVALIVKTILLPALMTLRGVYSEDAPKCEKAECEKEDVSSLLQSRVHASLESRAQAAKTLTEEDKGKCDDWCDKDYCVGDWSEDCGGCSFCGAGPATPELQCTFVGMMEEDISIGEDSTDDGQEWGECVDDSGVTHYLFHDDELEKFGPGDKMKLTVSEVSGGQLPTAPDLPWLSESVPLYRIVSVITHEPAMLTEDEHSLTEGTTTTKEVDVLMMICNYKDQNAFITDEKKVMDSFYTRLGEDGQGSFADMLSRSSYGRFTAPRSKGKVVTVWINKNFPTNGCPTHEIATDCKQATRDQKYLDPDEFTFREFFIPGRGSGCKWVGLAATGCGHYSRIPRKAACQAWYRDSHTSLSFTRAHEIGHNLGFLHAGGLEGGAYVEYGDPQASMGNSFQFSSYNAASRYQGGFLHKVAGEALEFQPDFNAGNSGTFTLQSLSKPLGEPGSDGVAVFWKCPKCVPKVSSHSRNVGGNLWLQFRGDEGYSASKLGSTFQNKVYVHLARKYNNIVYGKGTEMWQKMGKGDSYRPPNSEATVTVDNIVGDLATVTILVGNPTRQAPAPPPPPTTQGKCDDWCDKDYCVGDWSENCGGCSFCKAGTAAFSIGDRVTWTQSNNDVPSGTIGVVTRLDLTRLDGATVLVKFSAGTYFFKPTDLVKAAIPSNAKCLEWCDKALCVGNWSEDCGGCSFCGA